MPAKTYKMRSRAATDGKNNLVDLPLEFEGKRAFAIWDSIKLGNFKLTARLELDPALLQKVASVACDYFYRGELVLPRPECN